MEDLIKEDEFIKKEYNPWPRFTKFYVVSFIIFWIIYFVNVTSNFNFVTSSVILALILIVLPIASSTAMILGTTAYIFLKDRKIISVLGLFYLLYIINLFAVAVKANIKKGIDEDFIYGVTVMMLSYCLILAIMSFIILAVIKKRRKKIIFFNENEKIKKGTI